MELNPHQLVEELLLLSHEYSKLAGAWADCIAYQAQHFNEKRVNFKSDNACQKAFDFTEKGIEMQVIKAKLKSKEKRMSAIRTAVRLAEVEARNLM
jgi:hypothetical protein